MTNYIIASSKNCFKEHPKSKEYGALNFIEISNKEDLNLEYLEIYIKKILVRVNSTGKS